MYSQIKKHVKRMKNDEWRKNKEKEKNKKK